ncbi:hypothetical protein JCM19235_6119 [Vibrio maritimus]|uniref:Uncharacterized protein n=1 Tax=Vibrio maritimus TaxID=990268 RepID=A0A090RQM8_9VIBR|nr:hypothetical protein JCM19235_6119 [Vibrio maritimus]
MLYDSTAEKLVVVDAGELEEHPIKADVARANADSASVCFMFPP